MEKHLFDNAVTATPDPTAPTCERCGAKVHSPCPTDAEQATCQLPDFCFPDGRRKRWDEGEHEGCGKDTERAVREYSSLTPTKEPT